MKGQLRDIVVAMDNSPFSLTAVNWGANLAKTAGSRLTLVHVLEIHYLNSSMLADISSAIGVVPIEHAFENYKNALSERGKNIISAGEKICQTLGVSAESRIVHGIFHEEIKEITRDTNLLILGRRGDHSQFGRHLLGASGERAIRHVDCSCLIVPENYCPPEMVAVFP
jgi:nucleotide-binding universal stress UspA family protein